MEKEFVDLILKDLSGNITPEEKKYLSKYLPGNEAKYAELEEVWSKSREKGSVSFDEDKGWNKLNDRILASSKPKRVFFRKLIIGVAALAVLLLSVSFWIFNQEYTKEAYTSNSYLEIFYLPDGTQVWLNKNSTITLENFSESERLVHLVGEAYFKVAKDPSRPFTIIAGDSKTRVLGTEFTLKAYPDQDKIEINVESGRVEFSSIGNKKNSKILYKNESGYLSNLSGVVEKVTKPYTEAKWIATKIKSSPKAEKKKINEVEKFKDYLNNDFVLHHNFVKQVVVDGEIKNQAVFASYKNIKLKVIYKTKDNELKEEYQYFSQSLKPGENLKYKFRMGFWFKHVDIQSIEIEDAHAIH